MANKTTIRYEFKDVKKAGWETVQEARELWLETGQEVGESKASQQASNRGYALQVGIAKERIGHQSARIVAATHTSKWGDDPWFLRFFEYGTVYIQAMPFIRPAARSANKVFIGHLGTHLESKIRRKSWKKRRV